MRRRATFIHDPNDDFNPADIQLKRQQLLHPGLQAAREERLTFGLNELPQELVEVLTESHELRIRWTSGSFYNATAPFLSSLSPGLHAHYTPLHNQQRCSICSILKIFDDGLICDSAYESFIKPNLISERFGAAASLQYHAVLPSLTRLVAYIQRNICSESDISCFHTASLLNAADYVDFDYDSIAHALTLTAFWSKPLPAYYDPIGGLTFLDQWPLDIPSTQSHKVEVGIMTGSKASDAHEIQLGGFLAVVGEDDEPKPTLFSFPSRHHSLSSTQAQVQKFSVSFTTPTGLHPTMRIVFPSASSLIPPSTKPVDSTCALHTYLTLPSGIFADEYAFPKSISDSDPLFQQANNILSLRAIAGELDLEAPDYVVKKWGSTLLLELATPTSTATGQPASDSWVVSIPLHLRYQRPSNESHSDIQLPWPVVFWACTAEDGTKFPVNPFDRTNLGYDGLFGSRTMFYHVPPNPPNGKLIETISVPVLNTAKVGGNQVVELGTVAVILLGFLWVAVRLWPGIADQLGFGRNTTAQTKMSKHDPKAAGSKKQQ